jgi:hypothetical protein
MAPIGLVVFMVLTVLAARKVVPCVLVVHLVLTVQQVLHVLVVRFVLLVQTGLFVQIIRGPLSRVPSVLFVLTVLNKGIGRVAG